jgi:phosphate:Na+ symporter
VAIVSAALIAVLLQSSTATIGLAIGLAAGGVFSNASEIPWIVGTNLGVSLTSLLVGWKSWDGRRLGAATLAARLVIAIPLILLANPILAGLSHMPLSPIQRIAFLQTGFNLIVGLCAIPFLGPIIVGVRYFVAPQPGTEAPKEQKFLDEAALSSPSMALAQATRQIQLMADMVGTILDQYWIAETTRNTDLAKRIQSQDVKIDALNTDLNHYLSRIGEGMSPEDTEWQFTLLAFANELESVGDIIDKHLCDSVLRRAAELVPFSPSDQEILAAVQAKLVKRFQRATAFLSWRDKEAAKEFLDDKEKFNEECRLLEKDHFHRLRTRDHITLGSSPYFLDILNSFRRINSHISSIAYSFEL